MLYGTVQTLTMFLLVAEGQTLASVYSVAHNERLSHVVHYSSCHSLPPDSMGKPPSRNDLLREIMLFEALTELGSANSTSSSGSSSSSDSESESEDDPIEHFMDEISTKR